MSSQVVITELPSAGAITGTEAVPIVQNGVTVQTTTAAISASPSQVYTYLTVNQTPQLANSRYVGVTNGLSITDGGAQGLFNISTTGALLSLVNSSAGIQVKTNATTLVNRSITIANSGLSATNGDGIAGDPTLSLTGQSLNFANASFNGFVVLSTAGNITSAVITGTASQIDVANGTGVGGNPTVSISNNPVVPGTGGMILPVGTTGQRGTSTDGNLRYNTTTASFEGYANGAWGSIVSGSGVSAISFGSTGLTPATSTTGVVTVAGTLAVLSGGTGVTTSTGTTNVVLSNSPTLVTPNLGTPSFLLGTNITGTAAGLTAGTVTTNANLTGDVTSVGNATTLATVASAGVTGSSTAIPVVTINAKGLTTSITTAAVIAPAGTLSGSTLASGVTGSSLTSLGTIASLVVTAGTISTTPSAATDIANKLYVDTIAQGLDTKASVVAGTTVNITLSGPQTIDGISIVAADRVLVKNQTASADNGLYLCAAGAWTRTTDMNTWSQVPGAYVFVETGTTLADTGWVCTSNAGGTIGVTAITWAQFSGAGSGVSSITFGTTGLTPATVTTGAVTVAGTLAVANGGTGLTAGTSGGILAYTATGTLASSALLAANALMIGGGAGVAPSTTTTGTGVVTALGVNTGTAGAFVVDGGALGTPSSGTVTNLTGTASININGTVGATTTNTGAFTTVAATTVTATTGIFGGTF